MNNEKPKIETCKHDKGWGVFSQTGQHGTTWYCKICGSLKRDSRYSGYE